MSPWNCQGREDNDVLPKGMYPINWQIKAGSDDVRITSNMRALKERLCEAYSKGVDLPSVHGCRLQHEQDDWVVDFDLRSSYFHGAYHESAFTWLGFSISDDELPQGAVEYLWEVCPQARFKDRWVFVYRSYAMGASPSVSDFQEIMSAMVDACKASGVGAAVGQRVEAWKGFVFIDDVKASSKGGPKCGVRNGSGFGAAVELGLQLMAQLLALGCFVNFPKKTNLLPRQRDSVFLGIGHDSIAMRFFLPKKRIRKLVSALRELRKAARVGRKVSAKLVARVIGILWSVQVCCHRAVAILTRAIIQTIAVMLRKPELRYSVGCPNFRWLLKQAWRGDVIWTQAADVCLSFYLWVPWDKVWAPFGYDTFVECLKDYVRYARVDELSKSCVTVASDASEVAVGGGCFNPKGEGDFECTFFAHHMLRIKTRGRSSAKRELEGIVETIVALEGAGKLPFGSRVIPVVDNESVEKILLKGSGVNELRELSDFLFFFCFLRGLLLFPVWQRRSTTIMTICDAGSRIVDSCAYSAHQDLFWGANDRAMRIWGHGFTFDRFGSTSQVQPVNSCWKIPFSSRYVSAFASGTDALAQDWGGHVNWVNAPFALIGRILSLLKRQRAVAAVVAPRNWGGTRHWWSQDVQQWSEGVVDRWDLHPFDYRCFPVNAEVEVEARRFGLAIVFLDFRRARDQQLTRGAPAEIVYKAWVREGRPRARFRYWREDGTWEEGLPL